MNIINWENNDNNIPSVFYNSNKIVVLDNVLSHNECENLKNLQPEFGKKQINSANLSDIIEGRCSNYINNLVNQYDDKICRIRTDKAHYWTKDKIYPEWALYKCPIGRVLNKHFDRIKILSVDHKSIYTIIVYLESSDGNTKFKEVEIEPKVGRVVIFEQDLLHEGLENKNNIKYYLRSEILYKRNRIIESVDDTIALQMFKTSNSIHNIDKNKSIELENAAFKLSPLLERIVLSLY